MYSRQSVAPRMDSFNNSIEKPDASLFNMMRVIACAHASTHASTHATNLMCMKNSTPYFFL